MDAIYLSGQVRVFGVGNQSECGPVAPEACMQCSRANQRTTDVKVHELKLRFDSDRAQSPREARVGNSVHPKKPRVILRSLI